MEQEENWEKSASEAHNRLDSEEEYSLQGYIAIKGTRNGLLLTLEPETPFSELLNALADRLAEAPSFFRGASLVVDTSRRTLRLNERTQLEDLLAYYHMSVTPVEQAPTVRKEDELVISIPSLPPSLLPSPTPLGLDPFYEAGQTQTQNQRNPRDVDDTLFLRRTVRSGQAIHHHSNVVVMGDVNAGAEIIAAGDVMVWGVLRGMVHAGYPDNESAVVCSLSLAPVQLRIAHLLSRPPEGVEVQPRPEVATIRQDQIVVETWVNGRSPRK